MGFSSAVRNLAQLCFDFIEGPPSGEARAVPHDVPAEPPLAAAWEAAEVEANHEDDDEEEDDALRRGSQAKTGRDDGLEAECRQLLLKLGITSVDNQLSVHWNPRLRSTAGYAAYPSWRIELNPRLIGFEGQVERTMKHELAHLVAYHRAGRRRIDPHGQEWRKACADLGIPNEPAHHRLPFPRSQMRRPHTYQCPSCGVVVGRVRPFKRATACLSCCRRHSGGEFDARFKFVKVASPARE